MINPIVKIALGGKKSSESLVGRKVIFKDYCVHGRLKTDSIYTIKRVSAGNYRAFVYLEELPEKEFNYLNKLVTPNTYNVKSFELV